MIRLIKIVERSFFLFFKIKKVSTVITKRNGFLYVSYNKKEEEVVGDKVYTNGLGGIYPSGIYIGQVSKIDNDSLGLQKQALVSIGTDYDTIRYIEVLSKEKVS